MDRVNEKSTSYLTVSFLDKDGAAATPASVSYRIDCLTTGAAIRGDTSASAASAVTITLTPDDNTLQAQTNASERRRVTVTGTYGASDAVREQFDYEVLNLGVVT